MVSDLEIAEEIREAARSLNKVITEASAQNITVDLDIQRINQATGLKYENVVVRIRKDL